MVGGVDIGEYIFLVNLYCAGFIGEVKLTACAVGVTDVATLDTGSVLRRIPGKSAGTCGGVNVVGEVESTCKGVLLIV